MGRERGAKGEAWVSGLGVVLPFLEAEHLQRREIILVAGVTQVSLFWAPEADSTS